MIAHEVTIFSTQFTHNISHLAACMKMREEEEEEEQEARGEGRDTKVQSK